MSPAALRNHVIYIPPEPTHCPRCGQPFVHHQAFGKPLGVSGQRSCGCVITIGDGADGPFAKDARRTP